MRPAVNEAVPIAPAFDSGGSRSMDTPEPEPASPAPEELLEIEPEPAAETQLEEPELPDDIFAFTAPLGLLGTLSVRWQSAVKSRLGGKHRRGDGETSGKCHSCEEGFSTFTP